MRLFNWISSRNNRYDGRCLAPRHNILFILPDQLRYDWVGNDPAIPVRVPYLEELRARGMSFSRAVCPSPLCAPSRACLALGVEYNKSPVKGNGQNLPLRAKSFYRSLRECGYHVMGCGKFDLNKMDCRSGKDAWGLDGKKNLHEWGFSDGLNCEGKIDGVNSGRIVPQGPYLKYLEELGLRELHVSDFDRRRMTSAFSTPLPDDAYCDNWIGRNGLALLDSAPADRPWFLQVNFSGPHDPWDITESMKALYADAVFPVPRNLCGRDHREHLEVRRNYSAMIENIDRWTGRFIERLRIRGELENTLIVFSSDHGEMLGEHGIWGKKCPNQPSIGVPLIISGPGVVGPVVHQGPVTTVDLAATFLDIAGVSVPKDIDSRSMLPVLSGLTGVHRQVVTSALKKWRVAFDGRYKLVSNGNGGLRFFDLDLDPLEERDVFADRAYANEIERLKVHLERT